MDYVKQPCHRDCPNRVKNCHATCEKYKKYDAYRKFLQESKLKSYKGFYFKKV